MALHVKAVLDTHKSLSVCHPESECFEEHAQTETLLHAQHVHKAQLT